MVDIAYQYDEMRDSEEEGVEETEDSEEEAPIPTKSASPYKLKNPMM
jgi:hypothetical protein